MASVNCCFVARLATILCEEQQAQLLGPLVSILFAGRAMPLRIRDFSLVSDGPGPRNLNDYYDPSASWHKPRNAWFFRISSCYDLQVRVARPPGPERQFRNIFGKNHVAKRACQQFGRDAFGTAI